MYKISLCIISGLRSSHIANDVLSSDALLIESHWRHSVKSISTSVSYHTEYIIAKLLLVMIHVKCVLNVNLHLWDTLLSIIFTLKGVKELTYLNGFNEEMFLITSVYLNLLNVYDVHTYIVFFISKHLPEASVPVYFYWKNKI